MQAITIPVGTRCGRLTVIGEPERLNAASAVRCRCACGNTRIILVTNLRHGKQTTCGCRIGRSVRSHGHTRYGKWTRTYRAWKNMINRCNAAPNRPDHEWYVKRGIIVCERWRSSFSAFLGDMGECPPGLQLDRIDNNGNYEPENCRWATPTQQQRNKRTNHLVEFRGQTITLAGLSEKTGVSARMLWDRIVVQGWTVEAAAVRQSAGRYNKRKLTDSDVNDVRRRLADGMSASAISRLYDVAPTTICNIKHNKTWKHVAVQA